jgi:small subunit ribosomal protein S17
MSADNTSTEAGEQPVTSQRRAHQRTEVGRVTSNKMQQTATVLVERRIKHPMYGKYMRRSKKYHVHDPKNTMNVGDMVQISECRPISKTKSWTLDKVLRAGSE